MWRWLRRLLEPPSEPYFVIKTIEGRRSDRRPVLPQEIYERQAALIRERLNRNG